MLESHINIRKGIKYIDLEGIELIKKSIGLSKGQIKKQIKINNSSDYNTLERYIENLESQIESVKNDNEFLKNQLKSKDEIIKNFQFLLKNEQENNSKLLEKKDKKIFKNKKNY